MRKTLLISGVTVLSFLFAAAIALAQKPGAHVLEFPVCTINDGSITCVGGSAAGLGNQPVIVSATVPAGCEVRPGTNQPGGHAQFTSEPIQPRGGRINFETFTLSADCPPGLNPVIGSVVTYTILTEGGVLVLRFTVTAT